MIESSKEKLIDRLKDDVVRLMARNQELSQENELLYSFIKRLGISIESTVVSHKDDFNPQEYISYERVRTAPIQFLVPKVSKAELQWWKDQLELGYLVDISCMRYKPIIKADLTNKDRFTVDYFNLRVKDGEDPKEIANDLGINWIGE